MQAQQLDPVTAWRQAIEAGDFGVWDLRTELDSVHHSPQWKRLLGFPDPQQADSTHFWRCRVHPGDLDRMLEALSEHADQGQPSYDAVFRLRSNGSGYRRVHSRGRIIERDAQGRALRMVGTMLDLTERPFTPGAGLAAGSRGSMAGLPMDMPFHELLGVEAGGTAPAESRRLALERAQVLGLVSDLLQATAAELAALRSAHRPPPTSSSAPTV